MMRLGRLVPTIAGSLTIVLFEGFFVDFVEAEGFEGWHSVSRRTETRYFVKNDRVLAIDNVSDRCNSNIEGEVSGEIVKVHYAADEIRIVGAVVEDRKGERVYVNLDDVRGENPNISRVDLGWITQGISQIIRKGQFVELGVFFCGAAGRVILVDDLRYGRR
jgi:hypothetical protein